jgi:hypothetical protein
VSKYIGVAWDSLRGKWYARVGYGDKRVYVGTYDSEEEAAVERDLEALRLLQEVGAWVAS